MFAIWKKKNRILILIPFQSHSYSNPISISSYFISSYSNPISIPIQIPFLFHSKFRFPFRFHSNFIPIPILFLSNPIPIPFHFKSSPFQVQSIPSPVQTPIPFRPILLLWIGVPVYGFHDWMLLAFVLQTRGLCIYKTMCVYLESYRLFVQFLFLGCLGQSVLGLSFRGASITDLVMPRQVVVSGKSFVAVGAWKLLWVCSMFFLVVAN